LRMGEVFQAECCRCSGLVVQTAVPFVCRCSPGDAGWSLVSRRILGRGFGVAAVRVARRWPQLHSQSDCRHAVDCKFNRPPWRCFFLSRRLGLHRGRSGRNCPWEQGCRGGLRSAGRARGNDGSSHPRSRVVDRIGRFRPGTGKTRTRRLPRTAAGLSGSRSRARARRRPRGRMNRPSADPCLSGSPASKAPPARERNGTKPGTVKLRGGPRLAWRLSWR